jgi:hypothetical protein
MTIFSYSATIWLPVASAATPEWLTGTLAVAAILLATLAVALMFRRVDVSGPAAAGDSDARSRTPAETPRRYPAVYYDPVLVISALGVIGLAIAAWLLR